MAHACFAEAPAPPQSWFLRSRWPSARPQQSSAWHTACCCARCRSPIRTASWPSSRSTPTAGGHTLRTRTSTTFAAKTAVFRRWQSTIATPCPFRVLRSRHARWSRASPPTFSRFSVFSRSSGGISPPATRKKGLAPPFLSAMDIGGNNSDRRRTSPSRT